MKSRGVHMKKLIRSEVEPIQQTINAATVVNIEDMTYDISKDSDDTCYTFESMEEYRAFLKQIDAD